MDEDQIIRRFDKTSTEFQSETLGKIIKSTRKFGVEIEMLNKTTKAISDLSSSISRAFGFDNDGSIQTNGGVGIEIVSPIMSGVAGENSVRLLFESINSLKFYTNPSCGLHVHLDGEGFKNKIDTKVILLSEVTQDFAKKLKGKNNIFIVKRGLMNVIKKAIHGESSNVAQVLLDEYLSTGKKRLYLSKTLGVHVPDVRVRQASIHLNNKEVTLDYYDFADTIQLVGGSAIIKADDLTPKQDDYLCIIQSDHSLENVKTLLYLYSVYNDIFMSMLPKSRRNNIYCQSLAVAFAPNQIESIRSYTDLETEWYKTRDLIETSVRKGNTYDDSRYYGVNLHSLFAKYGTIEMRWHSATLEPNKVLYWVALHQDILDKIVNQEVGIAGLRKGAYITNPEEKLEYMFRNLNLRTSLRKYVRQRIQFFENNYK